MHCFKRLKSRRAFKLPEIAKGLSSNQARE